VPQDDAIALLSTPAADTGTRLTAKEIGQLQKTVKRYETALKKLVPADELDAYWKRIKTK
jgi:hypothetical protein